MAHTPTMTLSEHLKIEIERRDLSQAEAAEHLGVSQQVLSRWILGQNIPKTAYIPTLARFLRLPQGDVRALRTDAVNTRDRSDQQVIDRIDALESKVDRLTRLIEQRLA